MSDVSTNGRVIAVPLRNRRPLVVALSLVLVLAAAAASLVIVQGVDSQIRDMQQTYEARRQARSLVQSLTDAETGQRGYLLTQDSAYLEPYRDAVASLDATYHVLNELVVDDPEQRARVASVTEAIEQKRSEMATTITLATSGNLAEALTILRSDAGRALMDNIRQRLNAFIAEEDANLVERNAEVDSSRQWLVGMIIVALGGAAVLTYMLFTRTQQQMSSLFRESSELMSQNEELEARVRARTAELDEARSHAERERARVEALLQDTNHRIGNSLATVSSLLGLQGTRTQSEEARSALESAQQRVQAIASGHRRLRLGDDLETTRADEFLMAVTEDLRATQAEGRNIEFRTDVAALDVHARDATTLGIIVGELVVNALKYAFPDGATGTIRTQLARDDGNAVLTVEDDGVGFDAAAHESGLGGLIVRQLATQFGGEPLYEGREGGGTRVIVPLPTLELADPDGD
jgi:two-component sensor histidine kinase/CHASE3 domain sensor protein